jgi:transcriptional regulator with XRE-family HTH domain
VGFDFSREKKMDRTVKPNVKRLRKLKAGFTYQEISEMLGLAKQTVQNVFNGKRVNPKTIDAFAKRFSVDFWNLVEDSAEKAGRSAKKPNYIKRKEKS